MFFENFYVNVLNFLLNHFLVITKNLYYVLTYIFDMVVLVREICTEILIHLKVFLLINFKYPDFQVLFVENEKCINDFVFSFHLNVESIYVLYEN